MPSRLFGAASGALILVRAAGGGLIVAAVLGLMSNYDAVNSPQWLWASLAVVCGAVIITVSWTFTALRPHSTGRDRTGPDRASGSSSLHKQRGGGPVPAALKQPVTTDTRTYG